MCPLAIALSACAPVLRSEPGPAPTQEFEIRNDRAFLGEESIRPWELRCGNALMDQDATERLVRSLDNGADPLPDPRDCAGGAGRGR